MRECDGCTLCCSLLEVSVLQKPAGSACVHCTATGCGIFSAPERPSMCGAYSCAWLWNGSWPEELRPDRCGVVFEPFGEKCMVASVDPDRHAAWREGAAGTAVNGLLSRGWAVVAVVGEAKHIILPEGRTPEDVWAQVDKAVKATWR